MSKYHLQVIANMYSRSGNNYNLLPFKYGPIDMCTLAKTDIYAYPEFIEHIHPTNYGCDWEIGTYTLDNYIPAIKSFPPFLKSGDYMVTFKLLKNGELVNGYRVVFSYTKI